MALVGYARVSTVGQSLDAQLQALAECSKIFREAKLKVQLMPPLSNT